MTMQTSRILDLPILNNPGRDNWMEVIYNGKNYRVQLGPVANLADQQAPGATSKYWVATPSYFIDEEDSVDITSEARIYYNGQSNTIAAVNDIGSLPALQDPANKRFDGLMFDTINQVYIVIIGNEAESPATPTYNNDRYLLLTWLLVTDEGVETQEPPQTHPQGTDQYLDKGGLNQVSAGEAKSAYLKSRYFAGVYDEVADLPASLALNSFAIVGTTELSFYLYSVAGESWSILEADGGGGPLESCYIFYGDLDTVSAAQLFEGPYNLLKLVYGSELSNVSFELRLDASSSWTATADLTAAQAWIDTNVSGSTVKWFLRLVATYATDVHGEAQATIKYTAS